MSLDTLTEGPRTVELGVDAALAAALEQSLAVWQRDAAGRWSCVRVAGADGEAPSIDSCGTAPPELVALLDEAIRAGRSCRAPAAVGCERVATPMIEYAGDAHEVAVAEVRPECAPYAQRLADAVLRDRLQQREIDWLREENFVFSQQVTDDFEELTFLRTTATRLVIDDTTLRISEIVEASIAGLREMIGAQAIYFLEAVGDGPLGISQECSAHAAQGCELAPQAVLRLAESRRERAAAGPCVDNDLDVCEPAAHAAGIKQFLMTPIGAGRRRFGWFVAVNRGLAGRKWAPSPLLQLGHDEFGTWEASLLSTAATLLASHAANLDLIREKEQLLINTVRSLVTALDSKDAYTRGHSERVALYSKRIAEQLGYEDGAAERLYLSGLLHDVGKIGVSDAVLRKPDKLTAEEYAEIKKHPDEGWAILRDLEQLCYVLPGVLHHHEQVSGAGYPDALRGAQIPLDARIMAVADAYDAMTSDRAYRQGMPHDKAVAILREGAGVQWDGECVEAFLTVIDDIIAIRYGYRQAERPARQSSALVPNCQS